ncbi:MAG: hypothetical protein V7606_695 [Burkholderiales bacterium]
MNAGVFSSHVGVRHALRRLLTPLVIISLLAASVAVWMAVVDAAEKHGHNLQHGMAVPPIAISKEKSPQNYTQPYAAGIVPAGASAKPVYLYISPNTARYLAAAGGDYESLVTPWRSFLKARKSAYIETKRLDAVPRGAGTVLIMPSAVALNEPERRQLTAFQEQGGNILATWSLGARNGGGEWAGYEFMEKLFGVTISGEVGPRSQERFLNVLGESPLTSGYPAGQRIWLEQTSEQMLRLSAPNSAAVYLDWMRNAAPLTTSAAVAYGEHGVERGHARWVVFGFAESSWGMQADELSGLMQNALHWLGHGVTVAKAAWPVPYRAAYVIEMDTEADFGNADRFARMMDAIDAKATFYCLTSEAIRFPHLVRDLARRHEIGYHGDVHTGFIAQPETVQNQRFERMQADMQSLLGDTSNAVGFRAPLEQYENTTERLLYARGFRHHVADPNRTDARLPFFSESGSAEPERALVVLPRTQHDDISLLEDKQIDKQTLLRSMAFDFDLARETGAMGLLSVHSQYFAKDSLLAVVMPEFLKQVARDRRQVWTTSSNDIADWWRERERLAYSISGSSDELILNVTISGQRPLGKASLVLANRRAGASFSVQPLSAGAQPVVRLIDQFRTAIVFEGLAPGRYAYRVTPYGVLPEAPPAGQSSRLPKALASRPSKLPAS